jgi:hypothetical protein
VPWDLGPQQEIEAFEALKPRLAALWREVFPRDDQHYTSVIVPSVSLPLEDLERRAGALFYEEALLLFLVRLRNPRARIVFVTSRPLPPVVLEYYFQFLAGIPGSHAAARLTLLSPHDGSLKPLAAKILERPRLVERIRAAIPDLSRAYLTVLRSTPLERRLAVLLGIPVNAADPSMEGLYDKSGARKVLREAGLEVPEGREDLRDESDVIDALGEMRRGRSALERAVLKLNQCPWDEGDAVFTFPAATSRRALASALHRIEPAAASEEPEAYLERFAARGGVVEELLEGVVRGVSGQIRINPQGKVILTSTHDELRSGPHRLAAAGCRFPADDGCRLPVQEASLRVGRLLAQKGLVSRVSVQFVVARSPGNEERLVATEINLGVGGSTHPLLAVRFLSGGVLDPATGLFHAPSGRLLFYRATDDLASPAYKGFTPTDVIEVATMNDLNYSHRTEQGTLFYMLGGVSEVGRVGLAAIGGSRAEAESVFRRAVEALDRESAAPGQARSPRLRSEAAGPGRSAVPGVDL